MSPSPLTGGEVITPSGPNLTIQLTQTDLNTIKYNVGDLCIDQQSCWLRISSSFVTDAFENPVIALVDSVFNAQEYPTVYTADTTPPVLTNFSLDMNSTILSLTFDEVIDHLYFNPDRAGIQNDFNGTSLVSLTGGIAQTSGLNTTLTFVLDPADVISLQANLDVATEVNTTWLVFAQEFIADVYGNMIDPAVNGSSAIEATDYTADMIRPTVVTFTELSLQENTLTVIFSEPILPDSYIPSKFTIRSSAYGGETHRFTAGVPRLDPSNPSALVVTLADFDVTEIKRNAILGSDESTTFIEIEDGAVTDTTDNLVVGTRNTSGDPVAISVVTYIRDNIPPTLLEFSFDLNNGDIVLTFDDVIVPTTFIANAITLLETDDGSSLPANQFTLTEGTTVSPNGFTVEFTLVKSDLDAIKMRDMLATSIDNTFMRVTALIVTQPGGLGATPVTVQAGNFTFDTTPPELLNFTYNADMGALSLLFSETVNVSSLDPTGITLVNDDSSQMYTLTGGYAIPNISAVNFELYLSMVDLHAVQELTNLATAISNTRLAIDDITIMDMANNSVVEIPLASPLPAINHVQDMTNPRIEYFTFDLNEGLILLTFNEAVNVSSLNVSAFGFTNANNTNTYTFTEGTASVNDTDLGMNIGPANHDVVVRLVLSDTDLNQVKAMTNLATMQLDTRLFYHMAAISDAAGNPIDQRPMSTALIAMNFTGDDTEPELLSFNFSLNTGVVSLNFSETVDAESIDFSSFTIIDSPINTTFTRTLTGGTLLSSDGTLIEFTLAPDDLNLLKIVPGVATSASNTYLFIDSSAIVDNSNNTVKEINQSSPLQAAMFFEDVTSPEIVSIDFDLNSGNLTLTFTESVSVSSLNVSALTLTNGMPGDANYTLTDNSTSSSSNGTIIVVQLSQTDLNAIKRIDNLATRLNSTFVSITPFFIMDTSFNNILPIAIVNASAASNFTPDATPPEIHAFDLEMTDGVRRPLLLNIQFTETIDIASVNVTRFQLQSGPDSATSFKQQLTGAIDYYLIADDTLQIQVLISDYEDIIAFGNFLVSPETSYLSAQADAVRDTSVAMHPLVEVPETAAEMVRSYGVDLVHPTLSSFTFDLNSGLLSLTWSENVLVDTLNVTFIRLQGDTEAVSNYHRLREAVVSYGANQTVTNLLLSATDLNIVKANTDLATEANNTFISLTAGAVLDVAENPSDEISDSDGLQSLLLGPDTTRPEFISFDFMLTTGVLTAYFSESVNASSVDPAGIILQNKNRQSTQELRLTGGSTTSPHGTFIEWKLSDSDLNALKELSDLYTKRDNAFLSIASYAITDTSGNPLITVPPSAALQVSSFNNDTKPPVLNSFSLDLDSRELVLTFSETVNVSTLNVTGLSLSNGAMAAAYTLQTSYSSTGNQPIVTVQLSDEDFNAITLMEICVLDTECFIAINQTTIEDMSGLSVEEDDQVSIEVLLLDETSPSAVSFVEFNLFNGSLLIQFSETVDTSTFNSTALTFQTLYTTTPLQSYTLTSDSYTNSSDGTEIEIYLSHIDLVEIQKQQELCSRQGNCYIIFTEDLIMDKSGNSIVAAEAGTAPGFLAMSFIPDTRPPQLMSFDFDAELGLLLLNFTEPVDISEFDPSGIHLQGSDNTTEYYTLTGGDADQVDSDMIIVNLTSIDFNAIRALPYAKESSNTYLSLDSSSFRDVAITPNQIVPILNTQALNVRNYISDNIPPSILEFTLNLNQDQLVITFTESVLISSLNTSSLQLAGNVSDPDTYIDLTGGMVQPIPEDSFPGAPVLLINLTQPDIIAIKTSGFLGLSVEDTFIRGFDGYVNDTSMSPSDESDFIQAQQVVRDTVPVMLMSFDLDVNTGLLTLTFDDVVNAESFDASAVTIQDGPTANLSYTLTTSSSTNSSDGYVIAVDIGAVDLFRLKSISGLAVSSNTSYLTTLASTVDDPYGVDVIAVTDGKAYGVSTFVNDSQPPSFLGFSLNMNVSVLSLSFSEGVDLSTLHTDFITLFPSNDTSDNSSSFSITSGSFSQSADGTVIEIALSTDDMNAIKANPVLATSSSDTYLQILDGSVKDLVGYDLAVTEDVFAVDSFTPDENPPFLTAFVLDLNRGLLNLTFSETIDTESVDITAFTLQNRRRRNNFTPFHRLTNSMVLTDTDQPMITIELSPDDLNSLKLVRQLTIDEESTYLTAESTAANDTSDNQVVPIAASDATITSGFTADTTEPELIAFEFDRTPGVFTLTFSEVIDYHTLFNFTQITILSSNTSANLSYTLEQQGSILPAGPAYVPVYTVRPTVSDINNIKAMIDLAIDNETTFIAVTNATTQDYSTNRLVSIDREGALRVSVLSVDSTPPVLNMFPTRS